MPETEMSVADEARRIALQLIGQYHPHLADEDAVRILYLFTTQKRTEHGRPVLAKTQTLSALQRFLSSCHSSIAEGEHFVMSIDLFQWALLSDTQREALIDHEICHIISDDDGETFRLRAHDVEEFTEIIRRHGLWQPDIAVFAGEARAQLALFNESPA